MEFLVEDKVIVITENPISPEAVIDKVKRDTHGAVVTFVGMVRGYSKGKRVKFLEHEACQEMAKGLRQIAEETQAKWQLEDVAIHHRVGKLKVGEITLVIAVAAPHRREAFEACQYAIDRIKQLAPAWEKEGFDEELPNK